MNICLILDETEQAVNCIANNGQMIFRSNIFLLNRYRKTNTSISPTVSPVDLIST